MESRPFGKAARHSPRLDSPSSSKWHCSSRSTSDGEFREIYDAAPLVLEIEEPRRRQ